MKKLILLLSVTALFVSGCQNSTLKHDVNQKERIYILEATRNYGGLIEVYREQLKQQESADVRYKLAQLYYLTNDFESSLYYIQPLLNSTNSDKVYLLYGKNLLKNNKTGNNNQTLLKTKSAIEKAIELNPRNGEAYNVLGITQVQLGQLDLAENSFNMARSYFYDEMKVINNLAMLAILNKNYRKAYGYLSKLYRDGAREPSVLNNMLYTLVKLGDYPLARQFAIDNKLSNNPDILINELKVIDPQDAIHFKTLNPNPASVRLDHEQELIVDLSAVNTNGLSDDTTATDVSNDVIAVDNKADILKNIKVLPTQTTVSTNTTKQPIVQNKANNIIDLRLGEHANYDRFVIESTHALNYDVKKINEFSYDIVVDQIEMSEKTQQRLQARLKRMTRGFASIDIVKQGNTTIFRIKMNNEQKMKVESYTPIDNTQYCLVIDFARVS